MNACTSEAGRTIRSRRYVFFELTELVRPGVCVILSAPSGNSISAKVFSEDSEGGELPTHR